MIKCLGTSKMTSSKAKHRPELGIPLTLLACLCNTGMATSAKWIGSETSTSSIVLMRFLISLLLLSILLGFNAKKKPLSATLKINSYTPYIVRITSAIACMYTYFYALKTIPLSTAVVLIFTSPLLIPIVTWVWKKTPIPPVIWWALSTGFLGVILTVGPEFKCFNLGLAAGVLSGLLAAISYAASRVQTKTEPPVRINFYLFASATIFSFAVGGKSFITHFSTIKGFDWLLLGLVGFFGFFYQVLLIQAVSFTRVRFVGAFLYFSILSAFFAEWLFFAKIPTALNYLGVVMILLGGILMALLDSAKERN